MIKVDKFTLGTIAMLGIIFIVYIGLMILSSDLDTDKNGSVQRDELPALVQEWLE